MFYLVFQCGLDLWTIAQAYVFFEKIIIKGLITKQNRRHIASASLILSSKLNDIKGPELTKLINVSMHYAPFGLIYMVLFVVLNPIVIKTFYVKN